MMEWERTFEYSVTPEEAWKAFTETDGPQAWNRAFTGDAYLSGGAVKAEMLDSEPGRLVRWAETEGDDRVEMTVTFTETDTGSSITITRAGFGEGDEWRALHEARFLGWTEAMHDFAVYLLTGEAPERLFNWRWFTGVDVIGVPGGLRVLRVYESGWGSGAGLAKGDLITRIAGAPVFDLADLWMLHAVLSPAGDVEVEYIRDGHRLTGSAAPA